MGLLEDILGYLGESVRGSGEAARQASERGGKVADKYIKGDGGGDDLMNLISDIISASPITGGMAKVFKPSPQLPYLKQLQAALESYLQPGKLQSVKNRLQPALKIAEGEPSLEKNLMVGPLGTFHNQLYEQLKGMPSKSMEHGYFDPEYKVFLDDMLNSILYDPDRLKTTSRLLKGGLSLDAIREALGFRKASTDAMIVENILKGLHGIK